MLLKYKTKKNLRLLSLLLSCILLTGCGQTDDLQTEQENQNGETTRIILTTGFAKDELFRIGSSSCYLDEFMVYFTNTQNRYEAVYGSQIWEVAENGSSMESRIKENVAARIAQIKTMNLLAQQYQVELTAEEENQVQLAAAEYYTSLNETEMETMGVTEELIVQLYREYLIAHKVYAYIIRDINPEISDDEARSVTVDWIFLRSEEEDNAVKSRGEEILRMLNEGEDFVSLALSYSDDKTITRSFGKGVMESVIEECAFNLAVNEVSPIIKGETGYYIIHCVSTLDRKETDANKEKIITQRKKEAFNQVYGTFVEGQITQLNEELWNSTGMIHNEQVTTSDFFDIYEKYFPEE